MPNIENMDTSQFEQYINKDHDYLDKLKKMKVDMFPNISQNDELYTKEDLESLKNIVGAKRMKHREENKKEYVETKPKEMLDEDDENDEPDKPNEFEEQFYKSFNKSQKKIKEETEDNTRLVMKSDIDNLPEAELDKALKRQNSFEAQQKFMELVQKDIDTYRYEKEKESAIVLDAKKMSRVSPNNILDVKKTKDSECIFN